jgi:hypothetical protein
MIALTKIENINNFHLFPLRKINDSYHKIKIMSSYNRKIDVSIGHSSEQNSKYESYIFFIKFEKNYLSIRSY